MNDCQVEHRQHRSAYAQRTLKGAATALLLMAVLPAPAAGGGLPSTPTVVPSSTPTVPSSIPTDVPTSIPTPTPTPTHCGDAVIQPDLGEQCDDGNFDPCDGCSNCQIVSTVCGDGVLNADPVCHEECDDGNRINADACRNDCRNNVCGDGIRNPAAEQCDDGNDSSCDACSAACRIETGFCGDGARDANCEQCDDGNTSNADGCRNDCQSNVCGDGFVNAGVEQCDDGDRVSGDGCDFNCTSTGCGNGVVTAGEQCDDGNAATCDGCSPACRISPRCGDGRVEAACGEQCDDGNRDPFDGCTNRCTICGDGIITPPEECDDQNTDPFDGCTTACTVCGNEIVTVPEGCDDGNLIDGDGCDADCPGPGCGNHRLDRNEDCDDGGVCVGGPNAGAFCTAHRQCEGGECRTFGGDGCAANCTHETARALTLDPERSMLTAESVRLRLLVKISGSLGLRIGRALSADPIGQVPVSIGPDDVQLDPIAFPGVGCVCIKGIAGPLPGVAGSGVIGCVPGGLDGVDLTSRIDHDTNDIDPQCAEGRVEMPGTCTEHLCQSGMHAGEACRASLDCGGRHEGVCNSPLALDPSAAGPAGSALIDLHLATLHILGRGCEVEPGNPAKGRDGIPCNEDDPVPGGLFFRNVALLPLEAHLHLTTGVATGEILDADDVPGQELAPGAECGSGSTECVARATGSPFNCSELLSGRSETLSGLALAGVSVALDQSLGDTVTTLLLAGMPVNIVGTGTPESCTGAALDAALTGGGLVRFDCGSEPVTIRITNTKTITRDTRIDGGGRIAISGGNEVRIFEVNPGITLEVRNLTITDGAGRYGSGGVLNRGTLTVANSTFSGGESGIFIQDPGTLTMSNSTFTGISGAIANIGNNAETVTNSTIAHSFGIAGVVGPVTVVNSIIADSPCSGAIVDGGHNLQWPDMDCGETIPAIDPRLDPTGLRDNGGPTQTIALLAGSPAIDAGDPEVCASPPVDGVDQRGYVRPGEGSVNCSIGAFEYGARPSPTCVGDCNNDEAVSIHELVTLVNIALDEAPPPACPNGIPRGAAVDIALLVQAVNNALSDCGGR